MLRGSWNISLGMNMKRIFIWTKKWRRKSPREKKKSSTQIREKIMHLSLHSILHSLKVSFLQVSLLKLRDFKDRKFMGTTRRA
ncbi:hypothetical protein RHMOL_Rhmol11G0110700 [Rhododendron molle]|uniref:Uncharacterized protein n=1 Tax=Rhododendron molle TaxID=49168 RepID=A0ACC0LR00_RHOML|nr:hypothetical protein RHMOL_Rhmol11G0110700 [Rhododendron molle]